LAKRIQFDDSAIRLGISIWHFDLAKRFQFDVSTIRFGNSIWIDLPNRFAKSIWRFEFALAIRQFDLPNRIGDSNCQIELPNPANSFRAFGNSIWQNDLAKRIPLGVLAIPLGNSIRQMD
jgi:hypothetical protein